MLALLQRAMETSAQGTDDATTLTEQIQCLSQQLADAGLAVGTRNTDQVQSAARLTVEAPGNGRQLAGQPLDRHQHSTFSMHGCSAFGFEGHCRGAARNGIGDMYAAILLGTWHGQEQITRTHLAAVQSQFPNQHAAFGSWQQLIEWHGHQLRPPWPTTAIFCSGGGRLSGAIFIKRSEPAITRLNTGAEIRPP